MNIPAIFLIGIFFLIYSNPVGVGSKKIALTFDADLTPGMLSRVENGQVKSYYNNKMADYIVKNKIPVTIFVTGLYAKTYQDEIRKLATNPFIELENHSYNHFGFTSDCYGLDIAVDKKAEIEKANTVIKEVTGKTPTWFRYPGGCHSQTDDDLVTSLKMKIASWTLVSGDAFNSNYKKIADHVLSSAKDGDIVVLHFGSVNAPGTEEALPLIVDGLKKKGFELVTLDQL